MAAHKSKARRIRAGQYRPDWALSVEIEVDFRVHG